MCDQPYIVRQCADCHNWDGRCLRAMGRPAVADSVACPLFVRESLHRFFRAADLSVAS